jgi:hypothetical protein
MKKASLLIIFCFVFAISIYAQNNDGKSGKGKIGITFSSFGENDVFRHEEFEGGASYNSDKFYTLGINYMCKLNKTFDFETGFEYSKHKIIIYPEFFPNNDKPPYGAQFSLVNIPITVRINFLKYCFVNGGLNLDFDPTVSSPIDSQDGIGALLGVGLKYDSKYGISAFVNPYIKAHSLISFSPVENRQRVMESGFRFGIMYKLK